MYEYKSKKINNYFELKDVCRKATSYFVGSFMCEMIKRREEWENPTTKTKFVQNFHNEYFAWDSECKIDRTRRSINCVIRIIESGMVEDALEYVINANNKKMDIYQAKINAEETLKSIRNGNLKY